MFSHAKLKLDTFWRTKSSLMIVLRRRLREAIRIQEELEKEQFPEVEQSQQTGSVETVDKEFDEAMDLVEEEMDKLVKGEKVAIAAEERPLEDFAHLRKVFKEYVEKIHALHQHCPSDSKARQHLSNIWGHLEKLHHKLDRAATEEEDALKKEYNALLRSEQHKRGTLQNLVVSYNEVMQLMNDAWTQRSQTREASHEVDKIMDEAQSAMGEIEKMEAEIKQQRLSDRQIDRLDKLATAIERGVEHLMPVLHGVLEDFLFIFKVIADLEIHYQDVNEPHIEKILEHLRETGFPQEDWEKLKAHYEEARTEEHTSLKSGVDAFRRMARLQGAAA